MLRLAAPLLAVAALALSGCFHEQGLRPKDYLSAQDYTTWVIEVDHAPGHRPDAALMDALRTRLQEVVNKPNGVRIELNEELPRGGKYSADDLVRLSREHQDRKTGGSVVVTHVLV
ncbi:MAG TPA: hypothetical protein VFH47_08150, partial [Candidatus Thermoplasmatota archaeon]|nr:hypothetical protein [Candidatus Thermoplasmatota archaeon]